MIKPICERQKTCIYLDKRIETYVYPISARSQIMRNGKELVYYCLNPKIVDEYIGEKRLKHEEKFRQCGYKVTKLLGDF